MRDHLFQNVMLKNGPRLAEFFALAENYLYIGLALVQCSITGKDVWGEPHDRNEAIRVLRRTLEQGINFIDTADSYGPEVSEQLIAEALHPYPNDLVIATKAGFDRSGPGQWTMNGNPKHLREACEGSLRRLKVERIDLYQLHRIDPH